MRHFDCSSTESPSPTAEEAEHADEELLAGHARTPETAATNRRVVEKEK